MAHRKMFGVAIAGLALGIASLPLAPTVFAASTKGLTTLSVQGVGSGQLAAGDCSGIACGNPGNCECLSGSDNLVGNQGFKGGQLLVALSIDTTNSVLPISNVGDCYPAAGSGTIEDKKAKNTLSIDISGLACPNVGSSFELFNGTYVVTGGGGKFSSASGTGAINGSQASPGSGTPQQVSIVGTVQP